MNWELRIDRDVHKFLKRIPKKDTLQILEAVELLPVNPYANDIEKMTGEDNAWRRRVGAYRILYEIRVKERVIYVFNVKRRSSHTY